MSRSFLRLLTVAALAAGAVGCGTDEPSGTTRSEYIEECSLNAGRQHCACVWSWFERNVSAERLREIAEHGGEPHYRAPELLRADSECARVTDNEYVERCVEVGGARSYCECMWRWFLRNVSRERAIEIDRRRRADPYFQSRETIRADLYCS